MSNMKFEDRIEGCLIGAAIGAELGFARVIHPERFAGVKGPDDLFNLDLRPRDPGAMHPKKECAPLAPMIDLGVRTYLAAGGRATPEDFAALLRDDPALAEGFFFLDGVHSVQELLKEGMNPRLSGLGAAPSAIACAAMPAVGIFHFADPEMAYLDGVEMASVLQPRLGADWAGLCAAAIAQAMASDNQSAVYPVVAKLARENNLELFYDQISASRVPAWNPEEFVRWWFYGGGRSPQHHESFWAGFDPMYFVLPLLGVFGNDPRKFMQVLVGTPPGNWIECALGGHTPAAVVGGAILGAIGGAKVFPKEWLAWATPPARKWFKLADVVQARANQERTILAVIDTLATKKRAGKSLLVDKISGCLLAGAIGNAMGSPVEGKFYTEIDQLYPGGVQTVLQPGRLESEDDNQAAMHLVEAYLARAGQPVMARHLGKIWMANMNREGFFPLCMGNSYDLIRRGWDARITGHWNVVTGSTVMCLEPAGLFNIADPAWAAIDATAISYMYQRGLDVVAAAMMSATVAEALRPEASVDSVLQAALDVAPTTPLKTFDKRKFKTARQYIQTCLDIADKYTDVLAVRKELYEKCLFYHMIDPLELWGLALAMFKIAGGDVRQAAIGGTNIGRDSDTIAGRAAMLAGTLRGAAAVPKEWVKMFSPASLQRIEGNAKSLADLILKGKATRLKARRECRANG
jgi:ADP-ribosylglycohydrolase